MNSTITTKNKRIDSLDLLKAIAIMLVLALHVPLYHIDFIEQPTASRVFQYFLRLLSEGVPLFVTINGFLILKKSSLDVKKHYIQCAKLFGLLVFWMIAYIVIIGRHELLSMTPSEFFVHIFQTGRDGGSKYTGGLWFLQYLFAVYLFVPAIWKIFHDDFKLFQTLFIISFILILGRNTINLIRSALSISMETPVLDALNGFVKRITVWGDGYYLVFFCFGGMIYHYYDWLISKKRLFVSLGILAAGLAFTFGYTLSKLSGTVYDQTFNYGTVFNFFIMLGLFVFCSNFSSDKNIITKTLSLIGRNTFAIYVIHKIIIREIKLVIPEYYAEHRVLMYIIVLTISTLFSVIAPKIPIVRKVTSLS